MTRTKNEDLVLKLLNDLQQAPHFPSTLNNASILRPITLSHLINTVLLPQLIYKLKFIPISDTNLDKIQGKLRLLTKQTFPLPINKKNNIKIIRYKGITASVLNATFTRIDLEKTKL